MALITVTGRIRTFNGMPPPASEMVAGRIKFDLSNEMVNTSNEIVSRAPRYATVSSSNGTFSVVLQSTLDCTPNDRTYLATFVGTMRNTYITEVLGRFTLAATPSTQTIASVINMDAKYQ